MKNVNYLSFEFINLVMSQTINDIEEQINEKSDYEQSNDEEESNNVENMIEAEVRDIEYFEDVEAEDPVLSDDEPSSDNESNLSEVRLDTYGREIRLQFDSEETNRLGSLKNYCDTESLNDVVGCTVPSVYKNGDYWFFNKDKHDRLHYKKNIIYLIACTPVYAFFIMTMGLITGIALSIIGILTTSLIAYIGRPSSIYKNFGYR